jgi:undecaprenyl-diphosphatase
VRYSFLLAIPAVVAAGLFQIPDIGVTPDGPDAIQMTVGTIIAFVVGFAVIHWLLGFVKKHSVYVFVWYRIVLGVVLFQALVSGWIAATT